MEIETDRHRETEREEGEKERGGTEREGEGRRKRGEEKEREEGKREKGRGEGERGERGERERREREKINCSALRSFNMLCKVCLSYGNTKVKILSQSHSVKNHPQTKQYRVVDLLLKVD